ncbi:hypothetical protein P3342_004181 [Pyrenophora teres f. teres]|nr:hypothetical protein P3342_004181 [Pyrenophora teres f. teres]
MAQPQAQLWIPEFDLIDPTWNIIPFKHSRLGLLPTELLELIIKQCARGSLPSLARISPKLRDLVQRHLYHTVELQLIPVEQVPSRNELWRFVRTLRHHPHVESKVKYLHVKILNRTRLVNLPARGFYNGNPLFPLTLKTKLKEPHFFSSMLDSGIKELVSLDIHVVKEHSNQGYEQLAPNCMKTLFKHFDNMTAHQHFAGPQKLSHLTFKGSDFHWILAKSPALKSIELQAASTILPDGSAEVNPSVGQLTLPVRSAILIPQNTVYNHFAPFLAHFPRLHTLTMWVDDNNNERLGLEKQHHVDWFRRGAWTTLIDKLRPLLPTLTTLIISVPDRLDAELINYLPYTLPCHGFRSFTGLKHLAIPYQALFRAPDPQWSHIQIPIDELLPSTLQHLELYTPKVAVLDWLATLPYYREHLPALARIDLFTSQWFGDAYDDFVFKAYPHLCFRILAHAQVAFGVHFGSPGWRDEWDDYDLSTLDLCVEMERVFGPSYRGTVFHPTFGDDSELEKYPSTVRDTVVSYAWDTDIPYGSIEW